MNLWGWVIAYVVGFSLLQVLIYRYLGEGSEETATDRPGEHTIERTAPPHERWNGEGASAVGEVPRGADPLSVAGEPHREDHTTHRSSRGRHCPRCGALNGADGAFTYCRNCIRPLG